MIQLRQEQIVFGVVAVVVGAMVATSDVWEGYDQVPPRPGKLAYEQGESLPMDRVLADSPSDQPLFDGRRDLFAPPRDTRPLPPLGLEEPPRPALDWLAPPTMFGPAPRHYGAFLRRVAQVDETPGLFQSINEEGVIDYAEDLVDEAVSAGQARVDEMRDELERLGYLDANNNQPDDQDFESPEEYAARIESYRRLYDWVETVSSGEPKFGRIENTDRYGLNLELRANDPIELVEIIPETGERRYPSIGATPIPREQIREFGFAKTPANVIEVFARELEGVQLSNYEELLEFADWCVTVRLEAPRALEVAELLYELCAAFDERDPRPRLGLARALEAGFQFDRAFQTYVAMRDDFPLLPEVYTRQAQLESRLRLFESAERGFQEALSKERGSWEARWGYGRFLLEQDRAVEALEHLRIANQNAPDSPEALGTRVAIRVDLGHALVQNGRVEEALDAFLQALRADADHQEALAGVISCVALRPGLEDSLDAGVLPGWLDDPTASSASDLEGGLEFELLYAAAHWSLERGDDLLALSRLLDAARVDPLRASVCWRAASFLAERAGYPDQAWRYCEDALEADPTDPWALFQRGRLLLENGEYDEARFALQRALEAELDFEDALFLMAELAFVQSAHEDAERYLERAAALDGSRADVLLLRGLNFLELDRIREAQTSLLAAKALVPEDPTTLEALAWCEYRLGDSQEAQIQLGFVDDMLRHLPEEHPHRAWSRAQIDRIAEHASMEAWVDAFERTRRGNQWEEDLGAGPLVAVVDGSIKVDGFFDESGQVRIYHPERAALFVSIEADVWISSDSPVHAGLFVARERRDAAGDWEPQAGVFVRRHREGGLQFGFQRRGQPEDVRDVDWLDDFQTDRWVRLRIERTGDTADPRVTISVDGTPIAENLPMPDLGRSQNDIKVGLFVEGEAARTALVRMDNVEIVRRVP